MKVRTRVGAALIAVFAGVAGAVALGSPASASTWGPFQPVHSSGYCFEAPGGAGGFGQQVILNYCGGPASHNQHIVLEDTNTGPWLYFMRVEGSPYCLVPGNADLYHTTIVQWTCDYTSDRFIWGLEFVSQNDTSKRWLRSEHQPAWCLDKLDPVAGSLLVLENCYITDFWRLNPA